jgi:integrase
MRCIYSPHSLRATAATLLLDAGEDIGNRDDVVWLEVTAISGTLDGFRRIQGRVLNRKEN